MEWLMPSTSPQLTSQIYRAGAGAGKTTTLIRRVLEVCQWYQQNEARFPRLVVTTFTRKATQELRERLMYKAQEIGDAELLDYIVSKNALHISTIHGILQVFLSRYGYVFDLDPGFQIIESQDEIKSARAILRDLVFGSESFQGLLEDFDFTRLTDMVVAFYEARAKHPNCRFETKADFERSIQEILRKLAGRADFLVQEIRSQTDDEKWLTFTVQLREAVAKTADWGEAYQSRCEAIGVLQKPRKTPKNPKVNDWVHNEASAIVKDIKKLIGFEFNPQYWDERIEKYKLFAELADQFAQKFIAQKREVGQLSMSDLELLSLFLIQKYPEAAKRFSEDWDYWFIDEYQDTSPVQVSLLNHLVGESKQFVVGDPQQSIYYFRGARCEVFAEKEELFRKSGEEAFELQRNYRSEPELLLFFNDFFGSFSDQFSDMQPRDESGINPSQKVATLFKAQTDEEELISIAAHIDDLIRKGEQPGRICVISRTNRDLNKIAQKLFEQRIPMQVHAASGFYDRREIRDILSILKFLCNPQDDANLYEVLRSPWFHVEDPQLALWSLQGPSSCRWDSIKGNENESIKALSKYLSDSKEVGVSETLVLILRERGFIDLAHRHDMTGRREANIWKLIVQLKTEEHRVGFNYVEFIRNRMADLKTGKEESDAVAAFEPNRVALMTVHKSKGLEFDHVLVPFMQAQPKVSHSLPFWCDEELGAWGFSLPVGDPPETKMSVCGLAIKEASKVSEMAEMERLLYVAMTRAKKSVFLSANGKPRAESWWDKIRLSLEPGLQKNANYSVEILESANELKLKGDSQVAQTIPRSPFAVKNEEGSATRLGVTEMLSQKDRQIIDIRSSSKRMSQGTKFHRLMELLSKGHNENWQDLVRLWFGPEAEAVEKAVEYVLSLESPPMRWLIEQGHAEWSYAYNQEGSIIEGQVDLWGESEEKIWIVDYKTGSIWGKEKAFSQLEQYAKAVQSYLSSKKPVLLAVLYPYSNEVFVRPL
jgi:ATP-dependent helicase/nuclease subunit A